MTVIHDFWEKLELDIYSTNLFILRCYSELFQLPMTETKL
jgi:hypothetical protein